MAEPLAVDPARLIAAASKLTELVFPTPPAPVAVPGSDAVSAAINDTMPGIESLVTDGLPGVTAALQRTATSMGAAADVYTKADQSLGQALALFGFEGDSQSLGANVMNAANGAAAGVLGAGAGGLGAAAVGALGAGVGGVGAAAFGAPLAAAQEAVGGVIGGAAGQAAALSPQLAATIPQVVQLAPMAQQMAPMGQQVGQSIQQAASQGSQGGSSGAQLASDTKPADEADKDDKDDKDDTDGQSVDGAAAGKTTLVSAPVQAAGGGTPPAGSVAAPI